MNGCNGQVYSQGSVDFITAQACIMLQNGLRPDQVGLGLPASSRGAGSGYVSPTIVNNALDCLTQRYQLRQLQAEHHLAHAARCDDLVDQLGRAERQPVRQPSRRPRPRVALMHNYRPVPVLEALGVCSEDEQLYRALLARPESTTTDLATDTGWPATRVGSASPVPADSRSGLPHAGEAGPLRPGGSRGGSRAAGAPETGSDRRSPGRCVSADCWSSELAMTGRSRWCGGPRRWRSASIRRSSAPRTKCWCWSGRRTSWCRSRRVGLRGSPTGRSSTWLRCPSRPT